MVCSAYLSGGRKRSQAQSRWQHAQHKADMTVCSSMAVLTGSTHDTNGASDMQQPEVHNTAMPVAGCSEAVAFGVLKPVSSAKTSMQISIQIILH